MDTHAAGGPQKRLPEGIKPETPMKEVLDGLSYSSREELIGILTKANIPLHIEMHQELLAKKEGLLSRIGGDNELLTVSKNLLKFKDAQLARLKKQEEEIRTLVKAKRDPILKEFLNQPPIKKMIQEINTIKNNT